MTVSSGVLWEAQEYGVGEEGFWFCFAQGEQDYFLSFFLAVCSFQLLDNLMRRNTFQPCIDAQTSTLTYVCMCLCDRLYVTPRLRGKGLAEEEEEGGGGRVEEGPSGHQPSLQPTSSHLSWATDGRHTAGAAAPADQQISAF